MKLIATLLAVLIAMPIKAGNYSCDDRLAKADDDRQALNKKLVGCEIFLDDAEKQLVEVSKQPKESSPVSVKSTLILIVVSAIAGILTYKAVGGH